MLTIFQAVDSACSCHCSAQLQVWADYKGRLKQHIILTCACTGQDSSADIGQIAQHDYMLVDFALGLLHSGLKKGSLGGQSPAALAMLDPMLPLLVRALRSRHANSVSLALKCLAFLIRLPLPGMHTF